MYKKITIFVLLSTTILFARHPFRISHYPLPTVIAAWQDGTESISISSRYLRYHPVFSFNTQQFLPYLLPKNAISYGDNKTVLGDLLANKIEKVMGELPHKKYKRKKKRTLTDFEILQDKNFNYKKQCGLIVLAFKEYPFVVKLFMETPTTIFDFNATGIEPTFFFYMGGGANRHLTGFTRIKNREYIIDRINNLERWKNHIIIPRKWFWLPKNMKSIVLNGSNIGNLATASTTIPGTYAIVADKIDFTHQTDKISIEKKKKMFMQLCNDLELNIDPHEKNFSLLEDTFHKKFTITLVDTEHFPTMVGEFNKVRFKNYNEWYLFLAKKCFQDIYLQTKKSLRQKAQSSVSNYYR